VNIDVPVYDGSGLACELPVVAGSRYAVSACTRVRASMCSRAWNPRGRVADAHAHDEGERRAQPVELQRQLAVSGLLCEMPSI
jgi:hypothetical protein